MGSDSALIDIGLLPGDVTRLKAGCVAWWNSSDAKRKCTNDESSDPIPPTPQKKICYERVFPDGSGANTFFGPILVEGNQRDPEADLFYCCNAQVMISDDRGFGNPHNFAGTGTVQVGSGLPFWDLCKTRTLGCGYGVQLNSEIHVSTSQNPSPTTSIHQLQVLYMPRERYCSRG